MNSWEIFTEKYREKFKTIPIYYAFNDKQLQQIKEMLGITNDEEFENNVVSTYGGGLILKNNIPLLNTYFDEKEKELKKLIDEDKTGEGFVQDMFYTELVNHEYPYTQQLDDTLEALGLTLEEINTNAKLRHGLDLASLKINYEMINHNQDFYEDLEK